MLVSSISAAGPAAADAAGATAAALGQSRGPDLWDLSLARDHLYAPQDWPATTQPV